MPVSFMPINRDNIKEHFWRHRTANESTDFAFSRFLGPFIYNYNGWILFADGADMLCLHDISELWALRDKSKAVMVVKNEHKTLEDRKFLNQKQTHYPRKNWSSLMLINCQAWRDIGPMEVNSCSGRVLYRFEWIDDSDIGELPKDYNHLVDVCPPNPNAKIVHFTKGLPVFKEEQVPMEYETEWLEEYWDMTYYEGRKDETKAISQSRFK
jgi:hypothetical protein